MRELIAGIPHAIVLRGGAGDFSVLVPATARPLRPATKNDLFSSTVLLDRRARDWAAAMGGAGGAGGAGGEGDTRHFLYPVHGSLAFLFAPSLASTLFLLVMRFMNRQYDRVFAMAESVVSDTELSPVEAQVVRGPVWTEGGREEDCSFVLLYVVVVVVVV